MSTGSPTTFLLGAGATLACATTANGTFTVINQLKQISYTAPKLDFIDVTTLGSPAAAPGAPVQKQSAPGTITLGTATVQGTFVPAGDVGQEAISTAFPLGTLLYFKHQFAPSATQTTGQLNTFAAYVSEAPTMESQVGATVSFNFSLQLNSLPVGTAGS